MVVQGTPVLTLTDSAIADPKALADALRPLLTRHPVPQSDERTRGLILEFGWREDEPRLPDIPALHPLIALFTGEADAINILAVNETPATPSDSFAMRPHVDRRWLPDGFGRYAPRWTAVAFLDFPRDAEGGELAVFPPGAFDGAEPVAREHARQTVEARRGTLIWPQPGRLCRFAGHHPHAVLGYRPAQDPAWRLTAVLAEFAPHADEPAPRQFVRRHKA